MILRGAKKTISKFKPIISFELGNASLINYEYTAQDYFDFLTGMGYVIYSIFGVKLNRENFIESSNEQFFWDYIAIPNNQDWPCGTNTIRVLVNQISMLAHNYAEDNKTKSNFIQLIKNMVVSSFKRNT